MRQALEMALEALELHGQQYPHMVKGYCLDAITAIKEALAQPEQEPFCTAAMFDDAFLAKIGLSPHTKLYTTPPQRTWVGLTDWEYKELHLQMGPVYYYQEYGQAIEAKLKEKNT